MQKGQESSREEGGAQLEEKAATGGREQRVMPRCVVCGEEIGYSNPRQYCRKTYCPEECLASIEADAAADALLALKEDKKTMVEKNSGR